MEIDLFLLLLVLNWQWYLLFLGLSALALLPVMRRYTISWYDPLRIACLFAVLANAIPPFLWVTGYASTEMFVYFLLSEGLFWLGLVTFAGKRRSTSDVGLANEEDFAFYFFLVCFALYVAFTLLSYAMFGIPIFMDKSRLSVFSGSGGFGILQRFNNFFSFFVPFYIYHMLRQQTHRLFCYASIAVVAIFMIFSGSKSEILTLLYAYFGYKFFFLRERPHTSRRIILYLGAGIVAALFILFFQMRQWGGEGLGDALTALVTRFVASGDCYFYAYPNDVYQSLDVGNKIQYLFSGLLTSMHVIPYEDVAQSIGLQLTELTRPYLVGVDTGPNSRMPILSYTLFGWGGLVFSYVAGWSTSYGMFRLPRRLPKGLIFAGFMTYVYATLAGNVTDFTLGIYYLFDMMLNLAFTVGVVYLFTAMTTAPARQSPSP